MKLYVSTDANTLTEAREELQRNEWDPESKFVYRAYCANKLSGSTYTYVFVADKHPFQTFRQQFPAAPPELEDGLCMDVEALG